MIYIHMISTLITRIREFPGFLVAQEIAKMFDRNCNQQTGKRDAVHCSVGFLEILTSAKAYDLLSRRHAAAG